MAKVIPDPSKPKFKRPLPGDNVYIVGGISPLGSVRLVDKRGNEITDLPSRAIRAILQESQQIIGKVSLVDSEGNPLPIIELLGSGAISVTNFIKAQTRIFSCPDHPVMIPGTAAAAITANDCLGTVFTIQVPKSGVIYSATFWDLDYEKTQVDLEIFKSKIPSIGDNAAWDPTDFDMLTFVTELQFFTFDDHISSATSEITNIGKAYTAPEGMLWIQAVGRSIPNIAAGAEPRVQLQILSDDPEWSEE